MKAARALYPTDFSEDSLERISDAVEFCAQHEYELIVLYTYRLINKEKDRPTNYSLKKDFESVARDTFKNIEDHYLKGESINYQMLSEVGFVDDRISHNIKKYDVDNILLCKSLYDQLEDKIENTSNGDKSLFNLPVVEV